MQLDWKGIPAVNAAELRQQILGGAIGSGSSRNVYRSPKPHRVIKESKLAFLLANFAEYYIWDAIRQSPKWKNVFGEVYSRFQRSHEAALLPVQDICRLERP
jgi:hypothetical protein